MGPCGLRRMYRPICTWILLTISYNICYIMCTRRANGDVRVVGVVRLQVSQKLEDPAFSNAKVLIPRRGAGSRFTNNEDVQLFRKARKSRTQLRDVLRERDHISSALVLATFTDPHQKAGGSQAAQHLLHLSEAIQNVDQLLRNVPRVRLVLAAVAMKPGLRLSVNTHWLQKEGAPRDDTYRTACLACASRDNVPDRCRIFARFVELLGCDP